MSNIIEVSMKLSAYKIWQENIQNIQAISEEFFFFLFYSLSVVFKGTKINTHWIKITLVQGHIQMALPVK